MSKDWNNILETAKVTAAMLNGGAYDVHPLHLAYAMLNADAFMNGTLWSKCPNCGDPYKTSDEGADTTLCSQKCREDYTFYLMRESEQNATFNKKLLTFLPRLR